MRPPDSSHQDAAADPEQDRAQFAHLALENLFAVAPDAIFVTDSEGVICDANMRAEEFFGYARSELIGSKIESLVPERFRRAHPSHREKYSDHPRTRPMGAAMSLSGLRKDGSEFPVDIMLKPIETQSGPMVLSFVRDETERRRAQEELRRADQQMRAILESVQDYAIYMLDREGRVLTWNPGAERIKGYTPDEIIGQSFSCFFTEEDIERGKPEELLRQTAERGRIEKEDWRVRKNGDRFWADVVLTAIHDATGAVAGFSKVVRDYTDRKRVSESVMQQLSDALLTGEDDNRLLEAISASLRELIPHDCATLGVLDPAGTQIEIQFLGKDKEGIRQSDVFVQLAESHVEQAIQTGGPLLIPRLVSAPYHADAMRHLRIMGMQSACCVPLLFRGGVQGSMLVASRTEGAFSREDGEMLREVAGQVAVAVHNSKLLRQMQNMREKLRQQKQYLEEEINLENQFEDIIGESTGLRQVLQQIENVAPTDASVLIEGETGTGKELLARAIHRLSRRSQTTFIKLNCAAIPSGLIESELFGHEKGAFTGAIARKIGKLELAHEGTLFLDEIGELPLELQPKLLRALQEREIERLGSNNPIQVNVRLIAATNRDLAAMVAEGQFRSDLYYRLKVFPIFAPPLRERTTDIPALVRHFVTMHSRNIGKNIEVIPDEAMRALVRCKWPGNIRELENFLERAVILTRGNVLHVPAAELESEAAMDEAEESTFAQSAREHIVRVLREAGGQIGGEDGAAARLGLKRTTLNSKMKKLGIERSDYMPST